MELTIVPPPSIKFYLSLKCLKIHSLILFIWGCVPGQLWWCHIKNSSSWAKLYMPSTLNTWKRLVSTPILIDEKWDDFCQITSRKTWILKQCCKLCLSPYFQRQFRIYFHPKAWKVKDIICDLPLLTAEDFFLLSLHKMHSSHQSLEQLHWFPLIWGYFIKVRKGGFWGHWCQRTIKIEFWGCDLENLKSFLKVWLSTSKK